jgi:DNA-binding transcriptional LysR family regulator
LVRRFVAAGLGIALVPAIAFPSAERPAGVRRLEVRGMPPVVYSRALRAGAPVPAAVAALLGELGSA